MPAPTPPAPILYYDGGCPVCSREIAMYRSQPGAAAVRWVDVTRCEAAELGGLSRADAMARLHLRLPDGRLVSGARAFTQLWQSLPRWAWLGRLCERRGLLPLLEIGYRAFLAARRAWRRQP